MLVGQCKALRGQPAWQAFAVDLLNSADDEVDAERVVFLAGVPTLDWILQQLASGQPDADGWWTSAVVRAERRDMAEQVLATATNLFRPPDRWSAHPPDVQGLPGSGTLLGTLGGRTADALADLVWFFDYPW